ncbi:uncharacterized protein BKCO1_11000155 [Diplodia corticola]|uniref:Uncharacterized protein n=1 Tax=Diplodia corticola TaxID=236234 RepID=A0A1J9R4W7_9PEZI|nr:uncharacterized protein BKCO1_11000155 [Diplodia corticola]OJD36518.1 hypothetical protein BKCO1_11000155 [Diplodia corticola]
MGLNALFTYVGSASSSPHSASPDASRSSTDMVWSHSRRAFGITFAGLSASYLLLKTAHPHAQQRPAGDYRVETHRSGGGI